MKKIIFLSFSVLALSQLNINAKAASPGCTVNWVNGDCGTTTNNGSDGSRLLGHVRECPKKSDDCECETK